jgi:molybdopterin/thiamine biosynthesis adenylyltransferase/rhodanese-related sulfurtransferase
MSPEATTQDPSRLLPPREVANGRGAKSTEGDPAERDPPSMTMGPTNTITQTKSSDLSTPQNAQTNGGAATTAPKPHRPALQPPHPLTHRYARQLLLPQLHGITGQTRLQQSRVLIIGLGGLGCPAALYLAAAGVGTLGLVDGDVVEESNLHRQILHAEERVGFRKAESAEIAVKAVNSKCVIETYTLRAGGREVLGILEGWIFPDTEDDVAYEHHEPDEPYRGDLHRLRPNEYDADGRRHKWDLVLDCTDNPATRYAINDAAMLCRVPLVSGAAQRGEGMLMVLGFEWAVKEQEEIKKSSERPAQNDSNLRLSHQDTSSNPPSQSTASTSATTTKPRASSADTTTSTSRQPEPPAQPNPKQSEIGRGPCYRCIYPVPPDPTTVASCAEIGVLGTAVGTIGTLMAQEALKLLVLPHATRVLEPNDLAGRRGEMLLFNAFSAQGLRGMFRGVGLRGRRKGCMRGGDGEWSPCVTREDLLERRVDYEEWCGRVEDVKVLEREKGERVAAGEFLEGLRRGTDKMKVVDVREKIEVELGAKLEGAINVPFSRIQRNPEEAFGGLVKEAEGGVLASAAAEEANSGEKVYFVCQRGNDSQIAAKSLMDLDGRLGRRRGWIGDVEGGFVAMEKIRM